MDANLEQLSPEKIIDHRRFIGLEQDIRSSSLVQDVLSRITEPNLKICDVGGASGVFLDEIILRSKFPVRAYNIEVLREYQTKQVNKEIRFLYASILNNDIGDETFDIITFRNVLHHLVGPTLEQTESNQEKALLTMFRLLKPSGFLIFEEQVNQIPPFSKIIYYLSRFANKSKIKCNYFYTGVVVVYFLSTNAIRDIIEGIDNIHKIEVIKKRFIPWHLGLRWKVSLLMSNVGAVYYVIRKV